MPPMAPGAYIAFQIFSLFASGFLISLGWHLAKRLIDRAK